VSVPSRSGRRSEERTKDLRRVKIPVIKRRKITTLQISRMNVMGQA